MLFQYSYCGGDLMRKAARDNRSNQLNRNNEVYWKSRGNDERPVDWEQALDEAEAAIDAAEAAEDAAEANDEE